MCPVNARAASKIVFFILSVNILLPTSIFLKVYFGDYTYAARGNLLISTSLKGIEPNYNLAYRLYYDTIVAADKLKLDRSFRAKVYSQLGLMSFYGYGKANGEPDYKSANIEFTAAVHFGNCEHIKKLYIAKNKLADRFYLGIGEEDGIPFE